MTASVLWCFSACIAWGVCPVLEKVGLVRLSPMLIIFIQSSTVAILMGIFLLHSQQVTLRGFQSTGILTILLVIACAILGGLFGEYAYLKSILNGETAKAVALSSAYPLVTLFCSYLFLGESITFSSGIGAGLIVCGVFCLTQ